MTWSDPFPYFRTYAANEPALSVARDLELDWAPYIVVKRRWEGKVLCYVFRVDTQLVSRLRVIGFDLAKALELHESDSVHTQVVDSDLQLETLKSIVARQPGKPILLTDYRQIVSGLVVPKETTVRRKGGLEDELTVFARLRPVGGSQIVADASYEFCVDLMKNPSPGVTHPLSLQFPDSADTVDLVAIVSSKDYVRPHGQTWTTTFRIDRKANATPTQWTFTVRAREERRHYSLTVTFLAAGSVAGSLSFTASGGRIQEAGGPPSQNIAGLSLPVRRGARLLVHLADRGNRVYQISMFEDGQLWDKEVPWAMKEFDYFPELESAQSSEEIAQLSWGLYVDLPVPLTSFLDRQGVEGWSTLFVGSEPLAPFEIMPLKPTEGAIPLGVDRPVARWIPDQNIFENDTFLPSEIACIRPEYSTDPLPSAADEQEFIERTFGNRVYCEKPVRTKTHLDALLNENKKMLIHFAGHSSGNPASLSLEDGKVGGTYFLPSRALIKNNPVFFINGCRAGYSGSQASAIRGHFSKNLLRAGCSGVIACGVQIHSRAARRACELFYAKALQSNGSTIADLVRHVRECALNASTPAEEKATYLSYLAYVPPSLRLNLE